MPEPITWHTTLLAEVGANAEGPLPWVERDYTPISTAKQWEQGRVEILIKIYPGGAATPWLRREMGAGSEGGGLGAEQEAEMAEVEEASARHEAALAQPAVGLAWLDRPSYSFLEQRWQV